VAGCFTEVIGREVSRGAAEGGFLLRSSGFHLRSSGYGGCGDELGNEAKSGFVVFLDEASDS